jgi:osmotically-inducible protein OsmY
MRPACSRCDLCSFRLQPEVFLLILVLFAGCGAATSWTKDDPSISTHVKIALLNDPQVAAYRIDAKTSAHIVTLSGTVSTQADADRAVAVARKVKGVKNVRSELRVGS